ncbi:MAG TPA: peptide chain release factor N(5)-glutamine methyltransferase [Candidatus Saccharimonadales bacterium]|nr:peptide chain release factor N(5)-glutamine methyltransferase [Candidatus Saccharimonadales bacterium]
MTIIEWLVENMSKLQKVGVDSPRRDCLVFVEDVLRKDRAWVVTHPQHGLGASDLEELDRLIVRRLKREPLAYIRGKAWFYGRFFSVGPEVMIPRPESEAFIELLKQLVDSEQLTADSLKIIDIGTGSGCLAITAKLELPNAHVIAVDIDKKALELARHNTVKHNVDVKFITSDLLTSAELYHFVHDREQNDTVLIANLPYVPTGLVTSPEILHEPKQALFSGKDGLSHYVSFWQQISKLLSKPQHVMTESLEKQHAAMTNLAADAGYELKRTEILVQHFEKIS